MEYSEAVQLEAVFKQRIWDLMALLSDSIKMLFLPLDFSCQPPALELSSTSFLRHLVDLVESDLPGHFVIPSMGLNQHLDDLLSTNALLILPG